MKVKTLFYYICLFCCYLHAEDIAIFTPPAGWTMADGKSIQLPPKVKVMVIGKGSYALPPSMNLSLESYQGTLKQYLKIIKRMNDERGYIWKDLGIIKTQAGPASLSQVDTKSQWGDNRQMHAILLKNGMIYILTASAMKDEFSLFYQDFFKAMRSLRVTSNYQDILSSPQQKKELKDEIDKICAYWKSAYFQMSLESPSAQSETINEKLFNSEHFQTNTWKPFLESIRQKHADLGIEWQKMVEKKVKDELFALSKQIPNNSNRTGG